MFAKSDKPSSVTGLEAFSFDYVVKWPVSLILSRKVNSEEPLTIHERF